MLSIPHGDDVHVTTGLSKLAGVDASEDDVNALVASTVPLGKVGSKWDIAIAAVFLCSSAARHLTGETFVPHVAAVETSVLSKGSHGCHVPTASAAGASSGEQPYLYITCV